VDVLSSTGDVARFLAAVAEDPAVLAQLSDATDFTMLPPTDAAMLAFDDSGMTMTSAILRNHFIHGVWSSAALSDASIVTSWSGTTYRVDVEAIFRLRRARQLSRIIIRGENTNATLQRVDVTGARAVAHTVDTVLLSNLDRSVDTTFGSGETSNDRTAYAIAGIAVGSVLLCWLVVVIIMFRRKGSKEQPIPARFGSELYGIHDLQHGVPSDVYGRHRSTLWSPASDEANFTPSPNPVWERVSPEYPTTMPNSAAAWGPDGNGPSPDLFPGSNNEYNSWSTSPEEDGYLQLGGRQSHASNGYMQVRGASGSRSVTPEEYYRMAWSTTPEELSYAPLYGVGGRQSQFSDGYMELGRQSHMSHGGRNTAMSAMPDGYLRIGGRSVSPDEYARFQAASRAGNSGYLMVGGRSVSPEEYYGRAPSASMSHPGGSPFADNIHAMSDHFYPSHPPGQQHRQPYLPEFHSRPSSHFFPADSATQPTAAAFLRSGTPFYPSQMTPQQAPKSATRPVAPRSAPAKYHSRSGLVSPPHPAVVMRHQ